MRDAAPAARRKRRSAEEIRRLLVEAARAEFAAGGYAGATTAAIARRAGVTEAQLFRTFPSKADLFRDAVFEPLAEHIRRFDAMVPAGAAAEADERRLAAQYIAELQDFLERHSRLLVALMVAQAYAPAASPPERIGSLDRYFERGAAMLGEGIGKGAEVDPRLTVRISFAAVLACTVMNQWLFPEGLASREEIDRAIRTFVVNGITPPAAA